MWQEKGKIYCEGSTCLLGIAKRKTPIVERSAKTHISLKETVIQKDEPDRGDRLIQVKAENNNGLDQEEADLMRQNYAVFEDIE